MSSPLKKLENTIGTILGGGGDFSFPAATSVPTTITDTKPRRESEVSKLKRRKQTLATRLSSLGEANLDIKKLLGA